MAAMMPRYLYTCKSCGASQISNFAADNTTCLQCSGFAQRKWNVNLTPPFTPHYNHSVGAYISSSREFDDALKHRSEQAGTSFSRIDPGEAPRPQSDDGVFDTQLKTLTDKGFVGSDGKITLDDAGNYIPK